MQRALAALALGPEPVKFNLGLLKHVYMFQIKLWQFWTAELANQLFYK